jgi:hypothetical protein
LGHGGPGPQDSSFELVCQKLTLAQEDYRRYDDNVRCGEQHQGRGVCAQLLLSAQFSRMCSRIPSTSFASGYGGLVLGILAPSLSTVDRVVENLSMVKMYIPRNRVLVSSKGITTTNERAAAPR